MVMDVGLSVLYCTLAVDTNTTTTNRHWKLPKLRLRINSFAAAAAVWLVWLVPAPHLSRSSRSSHLAPQHAPVAKHSALHSHWRRIAMQAAIDDVRHSGTRSPASTWPVVMRAVKISVQRLQRSYQAGVR